MAAQTSGRICARIAYTCKISLLALLFASGDSLAETAKNAHAVPLGGARIRVDGKLDEPIWKSAPPLTELEQKIPNEGAPASERTEVRFIYGADALYVGARMVSASTPIQAYVTRRDNGRGDTIQISLDTFLDRRTAVSFAVTAGGTRIERFHPFDRESGEESFDPVWTAKTSVGDEEWTAEMRIPYSQLRFTRKKEHVWGLQVRRIMPARNEESYWVLIRRDQVGWASRFGTLTGIEGIDPSRRIEVMPYAASDLRVAAEDDPANPFDGRQTSARAGVDFKMGAGPSLTLEGTIQPDFGQVEADPAVVNLSAFETFFDERRPFFIEGIDLLSGNGPSYFYSRRIGAAPRAPVDAPHVDYPDTTAILGAAKLTGRVGRDTSIGALVALTREEHARTWDPSRGSFESFRVAPQTFLGVFRGERQFGSAQSTAGVSLTAVSRDLAASDSLSSLLPRRAFSGGADWNLRFRGGNYRFSGHAGFSHVEGERGAILELQRSSARYFQRPDAGHTTLDPTRTSLSGFSVRLDAARDGGSRWLWRTEVWADSPGLELNDAGRLSRADQIFVFGNLRYRQTQPTRWFHDYIVGLSTENVYNFDGTRVFAALRSDSEFTFHNFWWATFTAWLDFRALSDRLTRGGPLMGTGQAWVTALTAGNSSSATKMWETSAYYGRNELGEETTSIGADVRFQLSPRWQLRLEPSWTRSTDPRQFYGSFDHRAIFSFIDRDEAAISMRLQYAVTPELTFELWAHPFAASGYRYDFGELSAPRSSHLRFYGRDASTIERLDDGSLRVVDRGTVFILPNRDFNVRSFRSNAVVRWEWRPGSVAYLVWQQNRFDSAPLGSRAGPSSVVESFGAPGDHVLALKVSYWFPVN